MTYICEHCAKLLRGPDGAEGITCPRCETGRLRVSEHPSTKQRADHERAEVMRG